MNSNPCELDGTCDDADPTVAEFCEMNPDTPFCSGDSVKECWDGSEVAEDEACPFEVTIAQEGETKPAELPETGVNDILFGSALGMVVVGTALVRFVKKVGN